MRPHGELPRPAPLFLHCRRPRPASPIRSCTVAPEHALGPALAVLGRSHAQLAPPRAPMHASAAAPVELLLRARLAAALAAADCRPASQPPSAASSAVTPAMPARLRVCPPARGLAPVRAPARPLVALPLRA